MENEKSFDRLDGAILSFIGASAVGAVANRFKTVRETDESSAPALMHMFVFGVLCGSVDPDLSWLADVVSEADQGLVEDPKPVFTKEYAENFIDKMASVAKVLSVASTEGHDPLSLMLSVFGAKSE